MTASGLSRRSLLAALAATPLLGPLLTRRAFAQAPVHGLAMHGDLKYPAGFTQFDYVNVDAPKGGELRLGVLGSFDSLNPFIVLGDPAAGAGAIYDTLTVQAQDEPFSEYGLLAESISVGPNSAFVEYTLRPQARFHDGTPVTAADLIFSLEALKTKGHPFYRSYYANVAKAEAVGEHGLRFIFDQPGNRELPLIMGQLVALPRRYWEGRDFAIPSLDVPLGSGPYRIGRVDAGRALVLERVADYWGRDLPVSRGLNNFDRLRYDYFRDETANMEAFKSGALDARVERVARLWATAYTFPAVTAGKVKKLELPDNNPAGMQAFVLNIRKPKFQNAKLRQALGFAFDFEWTNKALFYGAYTRTTSYFANSEMAATGLPQGAELALLEPFRDKLPPELFTSEFTVPVSDASGQDRALLRRAKQLLTEAGYTVKGGKLVDGGGQPLTIEFLLDDSTFERVVEPYIKNLTQLGIAANIRSVDPPQYIQRTNKFDFDVIVNVFGQSLSPGNEQREFWGSAVADLDGSRNLIGIKDPVVDVLIDKIIFATDREGLVTACRALDRVLSWGYYVVPHWYSAIDRIAVWDRFGRPDTQPRYATGFPDTWWFDPAKNAALRG
ncbi:ABC transporter substrate-binding protein [Oleomonas cavernae]|uniref:ABC transporter substrate-binding protein n=1 Tax=Oleomonas cavernae TaxID=2320859 RepID=A0A418WEL9_9PROT|nr:extracellular solute-binding protein [Oleomonas cavernae]RJF88442.1 ABC transporter substrate-binding protein [Oleomonas cavernae]